MKRSSPSWSLVDGLTHAVDRAVGWHRLPTPLGLLALIAIRRRLRQENLYDTGPRLSRPTAAAGRRRRVA